MMQKFLTRILLSVAVFVMPSWGCSGNTGENTAPALPVIIFDTDMGPDYDDVGAIAVLHALADSGECSIIATVASDAHPLVAPTIELLNRYYKRGTLPVGRAVAGAPD